MIAADDGAALLAAALQLGDVRLRRYLVVAKWIGGAVLDGDRFEYRLRRADQETAALPRMLRARVRQDCVDRRLRDPYRVSQPAPR